MFFPIIDQCRLFLLPSGIGPDIQMKMFEGYIISGQPVFCLIFILSKNKSFQSGALLKMPPSSPSTQEFGQ